MNFGSLRLRPLVASAAIVAAIALAGCETDGTSPTDKATKPLSQEMLGELEKKNMPKESPILVRLFKEEAEVEVWKQDASGRYALLKIYPICRWSGELGPKTREGDRQAPEGFYTIKPTQMNPNSHYYLSFDIGYPNAYDRAHGYTGSNLMVHGDCSSRGCYAMTDEQISEIYALARESFFGGQRSFQVQAYPFRLTPLNLARHRNNPNMAFWRMLKQGNDHFEVTHLEPKVDVCDRHYVFDAEPPANSTPVPGTTPPALNFNPISRCPAYEVNPEIAAEVAEKAKRDEVQTAEFVSRGTPLAPIRTGTDGGMNPIFLAKLKPTIIRDADGSARTIVETRAPGTIPDTVVPPHAPDATPSGSVVANAAPAPANAPAAPAPAKPASGNSSSNGNSGNLFTHLFSNDPSPPEQKGKSENVIDQATASVSRLFGGEPRKPAPPPPAPKVAAVPPPKPSLKQTPAAAATKPAANAATNAVANPAAKPAPDDPSGAEATPSTVATGSSLLNGAQPALPAGSFDGRWSGVR